MSINETLAVRGASYGDFASQADITQKLKETFMDGILSSNTIDDIPPFIYEAVDMIFHKLARVANGDPLYIDNFRDICGYSQLVVDALQTTVGATDADVSKRKYTADGWVRL